MAAGEDTAFAPLIPDLLHLLEGKGHFQVGALPYAHQGRIHSIPSPDDPCKSDAEHKMNVCSADCHPVITIGLHIETVVNPSINLHFLSFGLIRGVDKQ